MSKKLEANITCAQCKNIFPTELYRSIWIEYPENRSFILNDQINAVTCPLCKHHERLEFPFLATNAKSGFAIWYEPYPDPQIDKDVADYRKHMGPSSFYAKAPRIADWGNFKRKLLEMEASARENARPEIFVSPEMKQEMQSFIAHMSNTTSKRRGFLSKILDLIFRK